MFSFVKQLSRPENRFVAWIAGLAALGGFLFGFDTGVVGSAEPYFAKALHTGPSGESWVVGSLLLGAICGAAVAGHLADMLSRKWTKMLGGVVFFVAAIGSGFPPQLDLAVRGTFRGRPRSGRGVLCRPSLHIRAVAEGPQGRDDGAEPGHDHLRDPRSLLVGLRPERYRQGQLALDVWASPR